MSFNARHVAFAAGAQGVQIDLVAKRLVAAGAVRIDQAQAILAGLTIDNKPADKH